VTVNPDRPEYIAVDFDQPANADTVYNVLSALVDTALTQRGVTVAQLDLSDLAMRELVTVLHGCSAAVVSAELRPASQQLTIETTSDLVALTPESAEILSLGLGDLELRGRSLTCRLNTYIAS